MEKINGIIISGKVYEAVRYDGISPCMDCRFFHECCRLEESYKTTQFCGDFLGGCNFRYSPSLTERLNNPKTKNNES